MYRLYITRRYFNATVTEEPRICTTVICPIDTGYTFLSYARNFYIPRIRLDRKRIIEWISSIYIVPIVSFRTRPILSIWCRTMQNVHDLRIVLFVSVTRRNVYSKRSYRVLMIDGRDSRDARKRCQMRFFVPNADERRCLPWFPC